VYEGAPVAVTSFLSVVSKGAVLFVFVSVLYTVFKPLADTWYKLLFVYHCLTIIVEIYLPSGRIISSDS
jgi:NADH-quinone oxidoreductase subunit N